MRLAATLPALLGVPLDPDEEEARELLRQELAKAEYAEARPTVIDRIIADFWAWVESLFDQPVPGLPFDVTPGALALLALLVVGVLALLVGRPALNRRRRAAGAGRVFLEDDERTAAELRAAAAAAAARGEWALATLESFRAIARDLADRTIITLRPGSTAHDVARRAADAFPAHGGALERAASDFDDVRYLDREGTEAAWTRTRELDAALRSARPAALPEPAKAGA